MPLASPSSRQQQTRQTGRAPPCSPPDATRSTQIIQRRGDASRVAEFPPERQTRLE